MADWCSKYFSLKRLFAIDMIGVHLIQNLIRINMAFIIFSTIVSWKLYVNLDILHGALFMSLELLKVVEFRLWRYSQGFKISFGSHHSVFLS